MTKKVFSLAGKFEGRWPSLAEAKALFAAAVAKKASSDGGFAVEGLQGTDTIISGNPSVFAELSIEFHPDYGVSLIHVFGDGRIRKRSEHYSRGDLTKRLDFWTTPEGGKRSLGLFISPEAAWPAIEDFLKTDGGLSPRVTWINGNDLEPDTFPDPA